MDGVGSAVIAVFRRSSEILVLRRDTAEAEGRKEGWEERGRCERGEGDMINERFRCRRKVATAATTAGQ